MLAEGEAILIVGAVVSTSTLVVIGGVKVRSAAVAVADLTMVPLFKTKGEDDVMPLLSVSPACTVYRKTNVVVPVPET